MQWLNEIVDTIEQTYPDGEILVESGGSPSGTYHLGHMRELVTCDAIMLELQRRGRQARHVYFVDDLDVFRKVPVNVPEHFDQYLGMPICDVPSPDGEEGKSYADHFLQGLIDGCKALGVDVEFIRSHPKYRSGWFVDAIELCLDHIPQIRQTLETISNRKLDPHWTPIQVIENGRLKNRKFVSMDKTAKTIVFEDANGNEHTAAYDKGEVKLDWRLDWPARWWRLGVHVEPFGREHASAGGSYDTGQQVMRDVFKATPPIPVPYDSIHMAGDTKKMSASKGTAISAVESVQIMPAEVVRYLILRSPLNRPISFDPHEGVVRHIDEFAELSAKRDRTVNEEQLLYASTRGGKDIAVSRVPFSHLVTSYQASLKDAKKTLEIIQRTEHTGAAVQDADIIMHELQFIDAWLQKWAPEDVKFSLQDHVDAGKFNDTQKRLFAELAQKIEAAPADAEGEWFHKAIYELKDTLELTPKELFSSLYQVTIGKDSGPRAGWFLSLLPRDWLLNRLRLKDAVAPSTDQTETESPKPVHLQDDKSFVVDQAIWDKFPQAAIGYLVATLPAEVHVASEDWLSEAMQALADKGITAENLREQPEINGWREVFGSFGVKPSKYLASVEALAKRALKDKPARISPVVDLYNAISLKHLIPMGALDLDKMQGNIELRYGRAGETAQLLGVEKPVPVEPAHVVYADQKQILTWLWNHRDAVATAVIADTKHAVFFADSLQGPTHAQTAIAELADGLKQVGADVTTQGVMSISKKQ